MKQTVVTPAVSYDLDFYSWTQQTADLIRQRHLDEVDLENVADEIADMGKRDQRELRSRLIVVLMHLLKWQAQPEMRSHSSWRSTIVEQRTQIRLLLRDSLSLYRVVSDELPSLYMDAVQDARSETGLHPESFPQACPYTSDQILDVNFFPAKESWPLP